MAPVLVVAVAYSTTDTGLWRSPASCHRCNSSVQFCRLHVYGAAVRVCIAGMLVDVSVRRTFNCMVAGYRISCLMQVCEHASTCYAQMATTFPVVIVQALPEPEVCVRSSSQQACNPTLSHPGSQKHQGRHAVYSANLNKTVLQFGSSAVCVVFITAHVVHFVAGWQGS